MFRAERREQRHWVRRGIAMALGASLLAGCGIEGDPVMGTGVLKDGQQYVIAKGLVQPVLDCRNNPQDGKPKVVLDGRIAVKTGENKSTRQAVPGSIWISDITVYYDDSKGKPEQKPAYAHTVAHYMVGDDKIRYSAGSGHPLSDETLPMRTYDSNKKQQVGSLIDLPDSSERVAVFTAPRTDNVLHAFCWNTANNANDLDQKLPYQTYLVPYPIINTATTSPSLLHA